MIDDIQSRFQSLCIGLLEPMENLGKTHKEQIDEIQCLFPKKNGLTGGQCQMLRQSFSPSTKKCWKIAQWGQWTTKLYQRPGEYAQSILHVQVRYLFHFVVFSLRKKELSNNMNTYILSFFLKYAT
jgi:hypothetical protein